AVRGTSLAEDLAANALADRPVQEYHAGIHGLGDSPPAGVDQGAQVGEQLRGVERGRRRDRQSGFWSLPGHDTTSCTMARPTPQAEDVPAPPRSLRSVSRLSGVRPGFRVTSG